MTEDGIDCISLSRSHLPSFEREQDIFVVTACSSSESWELQQHPRLWHSRAGEGAVHSINSGHATGFAGAHLSSTWTCRLMNRAAHGPSPRNQVNGAVTFYREIGTYEVTQRDTSVLGKRHAVARRRRHINGQIGRRKSRNPASRRPGKIVSSNWLASIIKRIPYRLR